MPFVYTASNKLVASGVSSGGTLYAIVVNEDLLRFATTSSNALAGTAVNIEGVGSGSHTITVNSVTGMTPQTGVISTTNGSAIITGDEEGVAINGTKKVVEYLKKKKEKINFCLVGEPTNPNKLGEMIKIGRRGSMTGKLSVIGIQGHVAYPNLSLIHI